jgi:hypothetical protein
MKRDGRCGRAGSGCIEGEGVEGVFSMEERMPERMAIPIVPNGG